MTSVSRLRWLCAALTIGGVLLLATDRAAAQTTTGMIRGYVRDNLGNGISGADISARNPETGLTRTATTNTDGGHSIPGLLGAPPGFTVGASLQCTR